MKKNIFVLVLMLAFILVLGQKAESQWIYNGNHIYNTNSGNVGIGTSSPASLLYVAKNMTEPSITIRNQGGSGGAAFAMLDNLSGANWKFKATLSGGFKIRDNANGLDVISIEPNSLPDAICIKSSDNLGIGTSSPDNSALVEMSSTIKGFLLPRMTQTEIENIISPTGGMIVFCTTDDKFYAFVVSTNLWKEIMMVP